MAVYTLLEFDEIAALVAPLALGRLARTEGVTAGVENTTYFLDFECNQDSIARYVLTIAETLSRSDLEFIASLTHVLNERGLPVPAPVFPGKAFVPHLAVLTIHEKPALLVPRIAGKHPQSVTPELCHQIGKTLARLHLETLALNYQHQSHRSLRWVESTAESLLPHLNIADKELLSEEIERLKEFVSSNEDLPQTIIHGDLFRDNVLVEHGRITALIDFFSAGTGYLLLDLAIAVNDWCFDEYGNFNSVHYSALTASYCHIREPQIVEIERWDHLLRIAALRFWVSRLSEHLTPAPHAPRGRGKDPTLYRHLLSLYRDRPLTLKP